MFIRNQNKCYRSLKRGKEEKGKMKKLLSPLTIAIVSTLMLSMVFVVPMTYATGATIWTDKPDYSPGDTPIISGSGFLLNANVTISITRPNSTMDRIYATTNGSGGFTCDYQLDGVTGTYNITATDGTNTATTQFTDTAVVKISVTVSPSSVVAGSTTTFTVTVSVPTPSTSYLSVGSVVISMGAVSGSSWGAPSSISISGFPGAPYWVAVAYDPTIDSSCLQSAGSSDDLQSGQTMTITFSVTAPSTAGSSTWSITGYHSRQFSGTSDIEYQSISVTSPPAVSITITSSPVTGSGFIKVDSSAITTPHTYSWTASGTHSLEALSPVASGTGTRYVFTSWSAPSFGSSTSQTYTYTVPSSAETVTANYKTQYQVTFQQSGLSGDATGIVLTVGANTYSYSQLPLTSMWVDDGTAYSYTGTVSAGTGKQYVLTGVTGPHSPVHSSGTVTASYKTQYHMTVTSAYDTPTPTTGWFDAGTGVTASVTSPWSGPTGTQYVCIGWTGTGSVPSSGTGTSVSFNINTSSTITWNWKTQYYLTVVSPYDTPGGTDWYDNGTNAYATLATGVQNITADVRAVFIGWSSDASGNGTMSNAIYMNGPKTAIANWKIQYYLSVVTDPSNLPPIPGANWYDNCTWVSLTAPQYVPSQAGLNGVRYEFSYWDVDGTSQGIGTNPISVHMNAPHTATAHFVLQYLVTFDQTGLDGTAVGTVVTVDSSAKTYGDLPFSEWVDNGTVVSYCYESLVSSSVSSERFRLDSVTGPASPITVMAPMTATGNYVIQYNITFTQSGVGSDFTGTVMTIDGTNYGLSVLPISLWWDGDSSHTFAYKSPLTVTVDIKRYVLTGTNASSPYNVSGSATITGTYKTEYYVTFAQSGVDVDFTGFVLNVGGTDYDRSGHSDWYDSGARVTFSFYSSLVVAPDVKRYVFVGSSEASPLTVLGCETVNGTYKTEYYLALATSPSGVDSPTGMGWYDSGTYANISTAQYVVIVPGVSRYSFNAWTASDTSEITNTSLPSTTVLIDRGKTVTADYVVQYNPTANFTWSPPMPRATKTVTFDASTSTPNTGTMVSYTWDFGDGNTTTITSPTITHRYAVSKRYNVTLTVLNSVGLTNAIAKSVKITCLADINMDGRVDIRDIAMVTTAFGSYGPDRAYPGSPASSGWNPGCDINGDNRIDIYDVAYVAKYYGWWHDP
jgi:hypothetical protein